MNLHQLHPKFDQVPTSVVFPKLPGGESPAGYRLDLERDAPRATFAHEPLAEPRAAHWQGAYERARLLWTQVRISYEHYLSHVHALGQCEVAAHAIDLYLAAACCQGRRAAYQVLDRDFIERSRSMVYNLVRYPWAADDVLQDVRRRLLAGPGAKLLYYKGRGPLGSWVRAIALNSARDFLRNEAARRRREEAQSHSQSLCARENPFHDEALALGLAGERRRSACLDIVRTAFQSLNPSERQLLHDHFLRGLSIDELAPIHSVNRATIARRVHRATEGVRRHLRKQLAALYPRESSCDLDAIALEACRQLIADAASLLFVY